MKWIKRGIYHSRNKLSKFYLFNLQERLEYVIVNNIDLTQKDYLLLINSNFDKIYSIHTQLCKKYKTLYLKNQYFNEIVYRVNYLKDYKIRNLLRDIDEFNLTKLQNDKAFYELILEEEMRALSNIKSTYEDNFDYHFGSMLFIYQELIKKINFYIKYNGFNPYNHNKLIWGILNTDNIKTKKPNINTYNIKLYDIKLYDNRSYTNYYDLRNEENLNEVKVLQDKSTFSKTTEIINKSIPKLKLEKLSFEQIKYFFQILIDKNIYIKMSPEYLDIFIYRLFDFNEQKFDGVEHEGKWELICSSSDWIRLFYFLFKEKVFKKSDENTIHEILKWHKFKERIKKNNKNIFENSITKDNLAKCWGETDRNDFTKKTESFNKYIMEILKCLDTYKTT